MKRWLAVSLALALVVPFAQAGASDVSRAAQALARTGAAPALNGLPALRLATPDPNFGSSAQVAAAWDPAAWRAYGNGIASAARAGDANVVGLRLGGFSDESSLEALAVESIVAGTVHGGALAMVVPPVGAADGTAALRARDVPSLEAALRGGAGAIGCTLPGAPWVATLCQDPQMLSAVLTHDLRFDGFVSGSSWTGDTTLARVGHAVRTSGLLGRPPLPVPIGARATLARRLVQSGAILLKNDGAVLPFEPSGTHSLLVVGADDATLAALRAIMPSTRVVASPIGLDAAVRAARDVAACLVVLGPIDPMGPDETAFVAGLLPNRTDLVRGLVRANPRTAVLLEEAPGESAWMASIASVLVVWEPVPSTPAAVANLVTGRVAPSGRLPARAAGLPVGSGTTYTAFGYSSLKVTYGRTAAGAPVTVSFVVANTGMRSGTAVARLMLAAPGGVGPRLAAFARVTLAPGRSRRVSLPLRARAFAVWSAAYKAWYVAPGEYAATVLDTAPAPALSGSIRIVSR